MACYGFTSLFTKGPKTPRHRLCPTLGSLFAAGRSDGIGARDETGQTLQLSVAALGFMCANEPVLPDLTIVQVLGGLRASECAFWDRSFARCVCVSVVVVERSCAFGVVPLVAFRRSQLGVVLVATCGEECLAHTSTVHVRPISCATSPPTALSVPPSIPGNLCVHQRGRQGARDLPGLRT